MRFLLFLSLFLLSFSAGDKNKNASGEISVKAIINAYEKELKQQAEDDDLGSISAAIFVDGKIIWSKAFGMADQQQKTKADTNTIYRTASITKTFTAYLMQILVQEGTISLDEPVKKYLPEITKLKRSGNIKNTDITFRQLANHTSGIPREPNLEGAAEGPITGWENKILEGLAQTELNHSPGEVYDYSNYGYGILGLALSRAAKTPYIQLVDMRIFRLLNLKNSFFIVPDYLQIHLSTGCVVGAWTEGHDFETPKKQHAGRGYKVPNGGIYSTPNELARFLISQLNTAKNNLLKNEYCTEMMTIQTPGNKDAGYGFGYSIFNNYKGIKLVEHDGGVAGYQSMMCFNPETKIGVILMRNYDFGLTNIILSPRNILVKLVNVQRQIKK